MAGTTSFPDILGYITDGARANFGVVQAALGVRPRTIPVGRPFEVLLLLQNLSDVQVDVTATLHLPKNFVSKKTRLVVGLAAAEVGYVVLPVLAQPDAGVGSVQKIGVEVDAKPQSKPGRARDANGGVPIDMAGAGALLAKLNEVKQVTFSAAKRMGRNILDAPVQLVAAKPGDKVDLNAGWVSLWTMSDVADDAVLLKRYAELFQFRVLRQLKRENTVKPLTEATQARFEAAGFTLKGGEAAMIAKLMALILEYAAPQDNSHNPLEAGIYNLSPLLSGSAQPMPRWVPGMLRALARDERVAAHAPQIVTKTLYEDLLRDALDLAFSLVETATGEDLGSEQEMQDYSDRVVQSLSTKTGIDFVHVYLPLVLGGLLINDQIAASDENMIELIRQMWLVLDERRFECGDDDQPVVDMAEMIIERVLQKYGYRKGST
jgi:hypothetical protein